MVSRPCFVGCACVLCLHVARALSSLYTTFPTRFTTWFHVILIYLSIYIHTDISPRIAGPFSWSLFQKTPLQHRCSRCGTVPVPGCWPCATVPVPCRTTAGPWCPPLRCSDRSTGRWRWHRWEPQGKTFVSSHRLDIDQKLGDKQLARVWTVEPPLCWMCWGFVGELLDVVLFIYACLGRGGQLKLAWDLGRYYAMPAK